MSLKLMRKTGTIFKKTGTIILNTFFTLLRAEDILLQLPFETINTFQSETCIQTPVSEQKQASQFLKEKMGIIKEWSNDPAFKRGLMLSSCSFLFIICLLPMQIQAIEKGTNEIKKRNWREFVKSWRYYVNSNTLYKYISQNLPSSRTVGLFILGSVTGTIVTLGVERLLLFGSGMNQQSGYEAQIHKLNLTIRMLQLKFDLCINKSQQAFADHTKAYEALKALYLALKSLKPIINQYSPELALVELPTKKQIQSLAPKVFSI
jgi:hypothetical protein